MFPSVFAFFQLQIHLLICSESLLLNNINCFTSVYDHLSVLFKNWISIDFFLSIIVEIEIEIKMNKLYETENKPYPLNQNFE